MCPCVAMLAQFAHQTAFQLSQGQRKDVIPRHPHDAQQVGDIHVMERLGRLVVGEDASLVMGSVENPFQFCLAAPLVAGDKLPRDVGRQTILEEFQREADAFSIGGCHVLLACGCYWNSVRSQSTNAVVRRVGVQISGLDRQAHGRVLLLLPAKRGPWPSAFLPGENLRSVILECHRCRLPTAATRDRRTGSCCQRNLRVLRSNGCRASARCRCGACLR